VKALENFKYFITVLLFKAYPVIRNRNVAIIFEWGKHVIGKLYTIGNSSKPLERRCNHLGRLQQVIS
jgi:hypothetical protein